MIDFNPSEMVMLLAVGALPVLVVWWIVRLMRGVDRAKQAWRDEQQR